MAVLLQKADSMFLEGQNVPKVMAKEGSAVALQTTLSRVDRVNPAYESSSTSRVTQPPREEALSL